MRKKLVRVAAVPMSLDLLLKGQLQFLNGHFDVLAVASPGEEHERIRKREGVRTVELPIERTISLARDLASLVRLYGLFRRERPWAVHSLTPKAGLLSMAAAMLARVPVRIHTFTGLIFPWRKGPMRFLLKQMDRLTCLCATHVIPEGEGVKRLLAEERITRKPLQVLAHGNINGVDLDYFRPAARRAEIRRKLGVPEEAVLFVFIGRVTAEKGVRELLGAFRSLQAEAGAAPVALALVGGHEDDAAAGTDTPGVILPGFQQDVRPWLEAADAFVLPSYREGFPNALLQAGAMGLPSVATDICGCNEIIEHGHTGLLVPPRDERALLAALQRLRDDPALRRAMGQNASVAVAARFERSLVWQALLDFYRQTA